MHLTSAYALRQENAKLKGLVASTQHKASKQGPPVSAIAPSRPILSCSYSSSQPKDLCCVKRDQSIEVTPTKRWWTKRKIFVNRKSFASAHSQSTHHPSRVSLDQHLAAAVCFAVLVLFPRTDTTLYIIHVLRPRRRPRPAARRRALETERLALEEEELRLKRTKWNQQHVSSTNIFELNVGGQTFATSRETLTSHRSAYLERLCGGANNDECGDDGEAVLIGAQRDAQGRFFIDRDPDLFRQILEYLRGSLDAEALSRQERKSCEPKRCTTS